MTPNEMAKEYRLILDKDISYSGPWFEDSEISITLTQAQDEYLKRRYDFRGNSYRDGFENSEKRRKDLAQLVKSATISYNSTTNTYSILTQNGAIEQITDNNNFFSDSSIIKPNGSLWKLPKDLLWVINEEVSWDGTNTCFPANRRVNVKPITHDEYSQLIGNSYLNPYNKLVWRMDHGREFNANYLGTATNKTTWYKVIIPATVDNTIKYDLTINENEYNFTTSGSATTSELAIGMAAELEGNETYYLFNNVIYVLSGSQVTTNDSATTNDITIELRSYIPSPGGQYVDQNNLTTDYKIHELITHGWDIGNYYLTYIRRPRGINVDYSTPSQQVYCELDESTHLEIIKIAVTSTLSSLQDPRLQSQMIQEQKSE